MILLSLPILRKRFRWVSPALLPALGASLFALMPTALFAQQLPIGISSDPVNRRVTVTAGGQPFTTFMYPDTLEKPVLYPIYAPDGQLITRGFPIAPRPGEPVDHPHHIGLWFNYEKVNGLDFWNNSYAIPAAKKSQYGWIRTDSILEPLTPAKTSGPSGRANGSNTLRYTARWTDQQGHVLLNEVTTYTFSATMHDRIIDRNTTLTAVADTGVSFPDAKDGMLGLRVTKELQIPSKTPGEFIDDKGNITKVAAGNTPDINGNYLTSQGKTGDSAWGTRGAWCMLYGKKQKDILSVVIIDHPDNPGYPTYWHARGYGLFAVNPLGESIFSNGRETMNFRLAKGQSATFRYRIVIAAGDRQLSTDRITQLADAFAHNK
ncbi:MAG TPA: PmoA family protein [Puia sp.]|nr:PmoA family protein [Puia sp.]